MRTPRCGCSIITTTLKGVCFSGSLMQGTAGKMIALLKHGEVCFVKLPPGHTSCSDMMFE
jgi:hypothetical protein